MIVPTPAMVYLLISLLALATLASGQGGIDWCSVKQRSCKSNPHIACNPNGFTRSGLVSNVEMIKLTPAMKDSIVEAHNTYRSQVASAMFANISFPTAANMYEMKWDNTLEYVARVHAAYGEMKHDLCRATPDFPQSGQNLFQWLSSADNVNVDAVLNSATESWFNEIHIANPALVDSFAVNHLDAGHFSLMVNDRSNYIGCGASRFNYLYKGNNWYGLLLTCNYQFTNMLNSPTYARGSPCQSCKCSQNYPSLCAAGP